MESAEAKVRQVPEDRIRTLECGRCYFDDFDDREHIKKFMAEQVARELIDKMFEHKKIEKIVRSDGTILYKFRLEVIVPPTPENHI